MDWPVHGLRNHSTLSADGMSNETSQHDAAQLGHDAVVQVVRELVARRMTLPATAETIPDDTPLFSVGVGMSSIDGMELLVDLERAFGVRIKDVDWWIYDSPTLANVADYLIDLTEKRNASRRK
jgi:acyl carrier protein